MFPGVSKSRLIVSRLFLTRKSAKNDDLPTLRVIEHIGFPSTRLLSLSLSLSLLVARSLFFHDKVIDIFQRNVSIGYTNVNTQRDSAIQRAYDDQRACFQTIQLFADFLLWSSCYLFSYFFLGSTFFRSHLRFCQSDWLLIIALVGLCSWKLGGGRGLPETRGGFLG